MKKQRIVVALLLAALLLVTGCQSEPAEEEEPAAVEAPVVTEAPVDVEEPAATEAPAETAPEAAIADGYDGVQFTATALDGSTVDESYLKTHKLTVVNFWATWCPPCVGEIPDFSEVAEAYADKGVGFLGVQLDDDVDTAKEMWESGGIVYPSVLPAGDLADIGGTLQYIPVTMLYGSDGKPVGEQQVGGMEKSALTALLDEALAAAE